MSAPETHDPRFVNTKDGAVWERRAVTSEGRGLYAAAGSCKCPEFLLVPLSELAEHGITGSADALPMPVVPELQESVAADRAKAPWGRAEDGRPFLPMGAHWTDVPELVDRTVAGIEGRVERAQGGRWYVAPVHEAAPGTVCTRYGGYSHMVGRFAEVSPADLELMLHAHQDLRWCLDMVGKLRDQVAWLSAERRSTGRSLTDAAEQRRADRDRIAELERPAVERHRVGVRDSYRELAAQARTDGDYEGEAVVLQQLVEREAVWAREDELAREFAADPLAMKPYVPGPSVGASADRLARLLAPRGPEGEHYPTVHHAYRLGHDLPEAGGES